jgi:hypothetical protein
MAVTIKSIDGRVLYVAEGAADVRAAVVEAAGKRADLSRAYLSGANGYDPRRTNDLLMLLDQPGLIRAYKLVRDDYGSPMGYGPLFYTVGSELTAEDADTDATHDCGRGINLATLPWVLREWRTGNRIMLVEFTAADIAAIPLGGKFRVRRCTVVKELDLVELGLVEKPAEPTPEPVAKPKRVRKPKAAE